MWLLHRLGGKRCPFFPSILGVQLDCSNHWLQSKEKMLSLIPGMAWIYNSCDMSQQQREVLSFCAACWVEKKVQCFLIKMHFASRTIEYFVSTRGYCCSCIIQVVGVCDVTPLSRMSLTRGGKRCPVFSVILRGADGHFKFFDWISLKDCPISSKPFWECDVNVPAGFLKKGGMSNIFRVCFDQPMFGVNRNLVSIRKAAPICHTWFWDDKFDVSFRFKIATDGWRCPFV